MENLPTYRLTQSGPETQEILDQVNLNTIDIEQLKRLYQALTQSEPEIIEPTDTWPVANPEENVIYRVIDRVNTPPQYYSDYMWNGTSMVPMAQYNNAIDNEPTASSSNLVKSGGVYSFVHANGGAYDISAAHAVGGVLATYDDLADALGTNGANVPAAVRKGGMSIKFVLSSDNKYVQLRLKTTSFSTKEEDWAICNDEFYTQTSDWAYVLRDSVGHILAGIQYNGEVEWALGVPTPVKNYVGNAVSQILNGNSGTTIDGLNKVFSFLSDFSTSDTLQSLLNTKKDKNDPLFDILNPQSIPDLSQVTLDKSGRIIESTDKSGCVEHNTKHNFKRIGFDALEENATSLITDIVEDIITPDNNEVELTLENGVFNGSGSDVASTTWIRSQKIQCDENILVVAICPETMNIMCNFETSDIQRANLPRVINAGMSVNKPKGFIRFGYQRRDGSDLNVSNLTAAEKAGVHVYAIKTKSDYDISIAAYNASAQEKENANIVCTDSNAQFILNACLSCIGDGINIKLSSGDYNLYKIFYSYYNSPCCLKTQDSVYNITTTVKVSSIFHYDRRANIVMSEAAFNSCSSVDKTSVLLVPCRAEDGVSIYPYSYTYVIIDGLLFYGYDYTKPIVVLDLAFASKNDLQNLEVRCDKYDRDNGGSYLHNFRVTPNSGCICCRVGYGSNDGTNNKVKSCILLFAYKGISCAGEHYIFEDVLTHHCYIGWAFGDYHTTGHFEHPNIMIGCSIEGCYRLMYLTKGGITTEGAFVPAGGNDNLYRSTLVCIGLSTELRWDIPVNERVEGEPTYQTTLPILEVLKGAYRGRLELDISTDVFESGSGKAFIWTKYFGGQTILGHGNVVDEVYE